MKNSFDVFKSFDGGYRYSERKKLLKKTTPEALMTYYVVSIISKKNENPVETKRVYSLTSHVDAELNNALNEFREMNGPTFAIFENIAKSFQLEQVPFNHYRIDGGGSSEDGRNVISSHQNREGSRHVLVSLTYHHKPENHLRDYKFLFRSDTGFPDDITTAALRTMYREVNGIESRLREIFRFVDDGDEEVNEQIRKQRERERCPNFEIVRGYNGVNHFEPLTWSIPRNFPG